MKRDGSQTLLAVFFESRKTGILYRVDFCKIGATTALMACTLLTEVKLMAGLRFREVGKRIKSAPMLNVVESYTPVY